MLLTQSYFSRMVLMRCEAPVKCTALAKRLALFEVNQPPCHGPVGVSLEVGEGVGVSVSVGGGTGVSVAVFVGVSVKVGEGGKVLLGVGEGVFVAVAEGVKVAVGVRLGGGVQVLNWVAVLEAVRVGVSGVGEKIAGIVRVGLAVIDGSAVNVEVGLGVSVGWDSTLPFKRASNSPLL
jgi:hypothetical protein